MPPQAIESTVEVVTPRIDPDRDPPPVSFLEEGVYRWSFGDFRAGTAPVGKKSAVLPLWQAFVVDGPLDFGALNRSFAELVLRQPVLRSVYKIDGGSLTKQIAACSTASAKLFDLTGRSEAERESAAYARITEVLKRGFDAHGEVPLASLEVFRLAARRHVLSLAIDAFVGDGRSLGLIWSELRGLYLHQLDSRAPAPPVPEIQYSDFAHWQRRWHSGETLRGGVEFWTKRLQGASPVGRALPADFPPRSLADLREEWELAPTPGGSVKARLPPELTGELAARAVELATTPFTVLQATYAAALAATADQTDVTMSIFVDLRERVGGVSECIGMLEKKVLLRLDTGASSWRELVCRAHRELQAVLAASIVQLVPFCFPKVSDLFRVMFRFVDLTQAPVSWPDLTFRQLSRKEVSSDFDKLPVRSDLTVFVSWSAKAPVVLNLVYSELLWSEATAQKFLDTYVAMLLRAVREPDGPVPLP